MRTLLLASLLVGAAACSNAQADKPAEVSKKKAPIAEVTVDQLDAKLAKHEAQAVDANGDATRKKMGVIPGAVLLPSSDSLAGLPADKSKELVFYCANTACGASHEAAGNALAAGYQNVKVMPVGIAGWVSAGKKTQSI